MQKKPSASQHDKLAAHGIRPFNNDMFQLNLFFAHSTKTPL